MLKWSIRNEPPMVVVYCFLMTGNRLLWTLWVKVKKKKKKKWARNNPCLLHTIINVIWQIHFGLYIQFPEQTGISSPDYFWQAKDWAMPTMSYNCDASMLTFWCQQMKPHNLARETFCQSKFHRSLKCLCIFFTNSMHRVGISINT